MIYELSDPPNGHGDRKLSVNEMTRENSAAIKMIPFCLPMINQKRRVLVRSFIVELFRKNDEKKVCTLHSVVRTIFHIFISISHCVDVKL